MAIENAQSPTPDPLEGAPEPVRATPIDNAIYCVDEILKLHDYLMKAFPGMITANTVERSVDVAIQLLDELKVRQAVRDETGKLPLTRMRNALEQICAANLELAAAIVDFGYDDRPKKLTSRIPGFCRMIQNAIEGGGLAVSIPDDLPLHYLEE